MNAQQLTDKADQLAENAFLKLIGRVGMASAFPVLLASMTWLGSTIWSLKSDALIQAGKTNAQIAEFAGQIALLNSQIQTGISGHYRDTDAARDFKIRDQKNIEQDAKIAEDRVSIKENRDRIRVLEVRSSGGPH